MDMEDDTPRPQLRSVVTAVRKQKGRGFREGVDDEAEEERQGQQFEGLLSSTAKGPQQCGPSLLLAFLLDSVFLAFSQVLRAQGAADFVRTRTCTSVPSLYWCTISMGELCCGTSLCSCGGLGRLCHQRARGGYGGGPGGLLHGLWQRQKLVHEPGPADWFCQSALPTKCSTFRGNPRKSVSRRYCLMAGLCCHRVCNEAGGADSIGRRQQRSALPDEPAQGQLVLPGAAQTWRPGRRPLSSVCVHCGCAAL